MNFITINIQKYEYNKLNQMQNAKFYNSFKINNRNIGKKIIKYYYFYL